MSTSAEHAFRTVTGKGLKVSDDYTSAALSSPDRAASLCKACGNPGLRVLQVTVQTHVRAEHWNLLSDGFRFCSTPGCDVIYFNNNTNTYFNRGEVKTRFGLKEKEDPRPICYCLGVLEEHIRYEALKKGCCDSLEDIVQYTKAGTGKWCLTTNPSGKCCRDYLPAIVEKYLSMKEARKAVPKLQAVKEKLNQVEGPVKRVSLKVGGMSCESCAIHVRSIIEKMGGKEVNVSLRDGSAELAASADVQPDEVAKAIEESGYKAIVTKIEREG